MDLERLRRLTEADPERITRQVRDQVREYIELNRRRLQPPPPDPRPAVIAFLGGLILGAVAMWLLDPEEGIGRRERLAKMFQRAGEPLDRVADRVSSAGTTAESDTAYSSAGTPVFGDEAAYDRAGTSSGIAGNAPGGLGVTEGEAPEPAATPAGSYASTESPTEPSGTPAAPTSRERSEGA